VPWNKRVERWSQSISSSWSDGRAFSNSSIHVIFSRCSHNCNAAGDNRCDSLFVGEQLLLVTEETAEELLDRWNCKWHGKSNWQLLALFLFGMEILNSVDSILHHQILHNYLVGLHLHPKEQKFTDIICTALGIWSYLPMHLVLYHELFFESTFLDEYLH
jgi:hypothetical protein